MCLPLGQELPLWGTQSTDVHTRKYTRENVGQCRLSCPIPCTVAHSSLCDLWETQIWSCSLPGLKLFDCLHFGQSPYSLPYKSHNNLTIPCLQHNSISYHPPLAPNDPAALVYFLFFTWTKPLLRSFPLSGSSCLEPSCGWHILILGSQLRAHFLRVASWPHRWLVFCQVGWSGNCFPALLSLYDSI